MQDNERRTEVGISNSLRRLFDAIRNYGNSQSEKTRKPEGASDEIVKARIDIMQSIATRGLVPADRLASEFGVESFNSVDPTINNIVYGRTLRFSQEYTDVEFIYELAHLLYMTDNSVIPVITERRGKSKDDNYLFKATEEQKKVMSDRIWSSMLVVCKGQEEDEITISRDAVDPADFLYFLIPIDVAQGIDEETLSELGVKIKIISNEIQRSLFHGDKISVPDYETALCQVVEETKAPIWIHGVRLPSESDDKE